MEENTQVMDTTSENTEVNANEVTTGDKALAAGLLVAAGYGLFCGGKKLYGVAKNFVAKKKADKKAKELAQTQQNSGNQTVVNAEVTQKK